MIQENGLKLEFSVLTLNTMGAPFKGKRLQRYQKIFQSIRDSDVEFFALQEAFNAKHTQREIVQPLEKHKFFVAQSNQYSLWKIKTTGSGLLFLSRHPIIKQEFHAFKTARSVDRLSNKGVLLTRILFDKKIEIDLYNTHLQASYLYRNQNAKTRMRQLHELSEFMATHSSPKSLVLILGDFNFKENAREYAYFMKELWHEKQFHFEEIMRTLHPCEKSVPLHTFQHRLRKSLREKLDHKFLHVPEGFVWNKDKSSTEILDWNVSDHHAVLTRLVFSKN